MLKKIFIAAAFAAVCIPAAAAETLTMNLSDLDGLLSGGGSAAVLSQNKAETLEYRRQRVAAISSLSLYPPDYAPSEEVFGKVRDGSPWSRTSGMFVGNPHMLVFETITRQVGPPVFYFSEDTPPENYRTEFSPGKIHVAYRNASANEWFHWLFWRHNLETRNKLRLWMINARDAGFSHAMVDSARSENIDLEKSGDIIRMPLASRAFLHYGANVSANNLSPADSRMVLSLLKNVTPTKIYVKLWRGEPPSGNAPEDFAFVIEIIPNADAAGYEAASKGAPFYDRLWPKLGAIFILLLAVGLAIVVIIKAVSDDKAAG